MAENWVSMPELTDLIGKDRAAALCAWHGGTPLYVPMQAHAAHALARVVGPIAMRLLCAKFSGEYITVPNGRKPEAYKTDVMRRLDAGMSQAAVALELGLTERYVRMVAADMPKVKQLPLPFLTTPGRASG
jgi:hypothetical protein